MRKGTRTVMTMSNNYKGPTEDFAMVVPVPVVLHKEDVRTLSPDVFTHIDQLSAPRLVEYWEQDPCRPQYQDMEDSAVASGGAAKSEDGAPSGPRDLGVKIEARFAVGEYEILILSAKEAGGLEQWLRINKYKIPKNAAPALAPYVRSQMKFFVAKVNIKKARRDANGLVVLSPLRFSFEAQELRLPVRLGLINADGKQDLLIYVLHPESRFEVANYKNIFIPTNLEVMDEVRKSFGGFYTALFDAALAKDNGKAVVTEYAWQTSSCDPCPVPPLQESDLATLGNDVISGAVAAPDSGNGRPGAPLGKGPGSGGGYYGGFSKWVLTRMHTRYDKNTLSEDLIFRAANPVVGGRSTWNGTAMELPGEVKPASENNFQGRYIIRHYWEKPVACANPRYGEWGGPPTGSQGVLGAGQPQAATDLANAKRGGVVLARTVRSTLPQLGLPGIRAPEHKALKKK